MKFVNPEGKHISSTVLGRNVLSAAVGEPDFTSQAKNWRKEYLSYFRKVAALEFQTPRSAVEIASRGLESFEQSVVTESGELLIDAVNRGWRFSKDEVKLFVVRGNGQSLKPSITANYEVKTKLAEQQVALAVTQFNTESIQDDLLIALAGGAEYSPARTWLDWGGKVAVVARSRKELWLELIARARKSSGTLLVPVLASKLDSSHSTALSDEELAGVAGLDLVEGYVQIAGWIAQLARDESGRIVLGSYAYAPGSKHIEVQAVQHCLSRVLTESLPKTRVILTWLATPTDSYAVPFDFVDDVEQRFAQRKISTKLRDLFFRIRKNQLETFTDTSGKRFAIVDATSSMQGPSYSFAKRLQRWMAYQQVFSDRQVAYLVSPPARTRSVLDFKILRATYAGAPAFGLHPFEVKQAVDLSAALLLNVLQHPRQWTAMGSYLDLAVHGGLWRLIYAPKSVWLASTVKGLPMYFK